MVLKRAARGRRIAWGAATLTILLGAAGGWAGRQAILESWWIHRLGSQDAKVRKEAAESLGRWGSARAAAALAEGLERESLHPDTIGILAEIEKRADPRARVLIVRRVLRLVEAYVLRGQSPDELIGILASAEGRTPEALPLLLEPLARGGLGFRSAAVALAAAWPATAGEIHAFLSTAPLDHAGGFLGFLALHRPTAGEDSTLPELGALPPQTVREMFSALASDHQRPEIRALAVAAAGIEAAQNPSEEPDLEFLRGAFKSDRDPLVRRAALRSAGFLGHVPGNLPAGRTTASCPSTSTPRRRRSCGWASSGRSATGPSRSSPRRARPGQERSILSGPSNGRLRESRSGSGRSSPGRWTRSRSSRAGGSSELTRERRTRFSSRPKAGGSLMP